MNQTLIGLALLLGLLGLGALLYLKTTKNSRAQGRSEAVTEILAAQDKAEENYQEAVTEEKKDVEEIRDRLDTDSDYANRVRNRYTRPG